MIIYYIGVWVRSVRFNDKKKDETLENSTSSYVPSDNRKNIRNIRWKSEKLFILNCSWMYFYKQMLQIIERASTWENKYFYLF